MALNDSAVCCLIFQLSYPSVILMQKINIFIRFVILTRYTGRAHSYDLCTRSASSTAILARGQSNWGWPTRRASARAARGRCLAHGLTPDERQRRPDRKGDNMPSVRRAKRVISSLSSS